MAKNIHAIREALIECGLLPHVTDYEADADIHALNYRVAWQVQHALLGRGYGTPAEQRHPIPGMSGHPLAGIDPALISPTETPETDR